MVAPRAFPFAVHFFFFLNYNLCSNSQILDFLPVFFFCFVGTVDGNLLVISVQDLNCCTESTPPSIQTLSQPPPPTPPPPPPKKRKFEELTQDDMHVLARKYNLETESDFNQLVHQCQHSDAVKVLSFLSEPGKITGYFNFRRHQTRDLDFNDRLLSLRSRPQKHFTVVKSINLFKTWCIKNEIDVGDFVMYVQRLVNKQDSFMYLGGDKDHEGKIYVLTSICEAYCGDVNFMADPQLQDYSFAVLDERQYDENGMIRVYCPTVFVLPHDKSPHFNTIVESDLKYYTLKALNPLMWLSLFQELAESELSNYLTV